MSEPSWADAFDSRGRWDWALYPHPRVFAPILLPFDPEYADAYERGVNARHEGLALECMLQDRKPHSSELLLVLYGPLLAAPPLGPCETKADAPQ